MIRAVIWGFGGLGKALSTMAAAVGLQIVAVVDTAPDLVGRPLADWIADAPPGACVMPTIADVAGCGADIVFHSTSSDPLIATAQILEAIAAGFSVVSAVEWLFHPWLRFGAQAYAIDTAARSAGCRVTGCGIHPGFCFDVLPIVLARSTVGVTGLAVTRCSNVSTISPSDFSRFGFGLTAGMFRQQWLAGSVNAHVGFPESVAALAEHVGLTLDTITDGLEPTLAVRPLDLAHRRVSKEEVVGITQKAQGLRDGRAVIDMTLDMFLDPAGYGREPCEEVTIEGQRSFTVMLNPGAPLNEGAAAVMLHAALALATQPAGFVSPLALPLGGIARLPTSRATGSRRSAVSTTILLAAPGVGA